MFLVCNMERTENMTPLIGEVERSDFRTKNTHFSQDTQFQISISSPQATATLSAHCHPNVSPHFSLQPQSVSCGFHKFYAHIFSRRFRSKTAEIHSRRQTRENAAPCVSHMFVTCNLVRPANEVLSLCTEMSSRHNQPSSPAHRNLNADV
jgi:hypothetical protein